MYVIGQNTSDEFGLNDDVHITTLTKHNKNGIKNIICGGFFNIFIDDNDNYWSAGHNIFGSCAIGKKDSKIKKLTQIKYFKNNKIKIKKICANFSSVCVLWITHKNRLYNCCMSVVLLLSVIVILFCRMVWKKSL